MCTEEKGNSAVEEKLALHTATESTIQVLKSLKLSRLLR